MNGSRLMEKVPCNLCRANDTTLLFLAADIRYYTPGWFRLVRCRDCGLVYLKPRPSRQEVSAFYPETYYGVGIDSEAVHRYQLEKWRKVEELGKQGRILDVGCGKGTFLRLAVERGWQAWGIEVSDSASAYARQVLNLSVITGELEEAHFPSSHFDLITLWHVFEHLFDPLGSLQEIHRILKEDGVLVIAVPNIESLQARVLRSRWVHLDVPRHLYHFSPTTLIRMLRKACFEPIKIRHFSLEHSVWGWEESILYQLRTRAQPFAAGRKIGSQESRPLLTMALVKAMTKASLHLGSVLLERVASSLGYGGIFEVYATKRPMA